jgi:hypothetical protein
MTHGNCSCGTCTRRKSPPAPKASLMGPWACAPGKRFDVCDPAMPVAVKNLHERGIPLRQIAVATRVPFLLAAQWAGIEPTQQEFNMFSFDENRRARDARATMHEHLGNAARCITQDEDPRMHLKAAMDVANELHGEPAEDEELGRTAEVPTVEDEWLDGSREDERDARDEEPDEDEEERREAWHRARDESPDEEGEDEDDETAEDEEEDEPKDRTAAALKAKDAAARKARMHKARDAAMRLSASDHAMALDTARARGFRSVEEFIARDMAVNEKPEVDLRKLGLVP